MKPPFGGGFAKAYQHTHISSFFPTDMQGCFMKPHSGCFTKAPYTGCVAKPLNRGALCHKHKHMCTFQSFILQIQGGALQNLIHRGLCKAPKGLIHMYANFSPFLLQIQGVLLETPIQKGLCKAPGGLIHTYIQTYAHFSLFATDMVVPQEV